MGAEIECHYIAIKNTEPSMDEFSRHSSHQPWLLRHEIWVFCLETWKLETKNWIYGSLAELRLFHIYVRRFDSVGEDVMANSFCLGSTYSKLPGRINGKGGGIGSNSSRFSESWYQDITYSSERSVLKMHFDYSSLTLWESITSFMI